MKRDFDLIRKILLEIEGGRKVFEIRSNEMSAALDIDEEGSMSREEADNWKHQLKLLQDTGLVEFRQSGGGVWFAGSDVEQGRAPSRYPAPSRLQHRPLWPSPARSSGLPHAAVV